MIPFAAVLLLTIGVVGAAFIVMSQAQRVLPPTAVLANHLETWPPQVGTEPIDLRVQSHVMEQASHRPGSAPGVIISYNCQRFSCDSTLIERLAVLTTSYPEGVFLAPYPAMDVLIAVTTRSKIATFDALDEGGLRQFVADAGWPSSQ